MKRFHKLIETAAATEPGHARPNPSALMRAGRRLSPLDVYDVLDELDDTSRQRDRLPKADENSSDAIAVYQEDLTTLLGGAIGASRLAIELDAAPRETTTRTCVSIALAPPRLAFPWWQRVMGL